MLKGKGTGLFSAALVYAKRTDLYLSRSNFPDPTFSIENLLKDPRTEEDLSLFRASSTVL